MLKKIVTAVVARSGGALTGVLLTWVVVRVLPLEQAGFFLLAFAVLNFLRPISVFGTDTFSLRQIGAAYEFGHWHEVRGYSLKAVGIVTVLTTALSCIVWALAGTLAHHFWEMPGMAGVLRVAVLAILPMGLSLLVSSFFQAIQRTVTAVMILAVNVTASLAAYLAVVPLDSATAVTWALVVVSWVNALGALGAWLWRMRGTDASYPSLRGIVVPAAAIWIATLLATTTKWNGQIIAAGWVSAQEIAYLAVAQRLSMTVSFIMIAINLVTAPMFAGLHKKNDMDAMQKLASWTTYLMVAIGAAVFVGIVSLSGPVMGLFGDEFRSHGQLLVILATGQLINAVTGSSGYMLIMGGYQDQYRNLIAVSTLASVALSFLLIPTLGVMGAAVATAIGVSGQHLGAAVMVKRYLGINIYQRINTQKVML